LTSGSGLGFGQKFNLLPLAAFLFLVYGTAGDAGVTVTAAFGGFSDFAEEKIESGAHNEERNGDFHLEPPIR
jgi:hypothetical protein